MDVFNNIQSALAVDDWDDVDDEDEFTVDRYNKILQEYGLVDYIIEDGVCRKDVEDFETSMSNMPTAEDGIQRE